MWRKGKAAPRCECFLSSGEVWTCGHYGRKTKSMPASPSFCNPLVFMQRCTSVPVCYWEQQAPCLKSKHQLPASLFADRYKTWLLSCCFKASNLQALPISIILMTSSEQLTCFSCRPTTWTCCLPSSRTRSFAFLFKRSNTYIQAIRLRQIWTKTPCR